MATPGWYPDPSGAPGYRFWDGQAWGSELSDNPYAAPPGSAPPPPGPPAAPVNPFDTPTVHPGSAEETSVAPTYESYGQDPGAGHGQPTPPQPPGYQSPGYQSPGQQPPGYQQPQQGWSSTPAQPSWAVASPPPRQGGAGKVVGLALLALVVVVALGVGTFFVVRSVTDDDETAVDDPTSSESADPTDDPTDPTPDPTTDPTTEPTTDPTEDPTEDPGEPVDPFTDDAVPTGQQCGGGVPAQGVTGEVGNQLTGGGLTMRKLRGIGSGPPQSSAFTFADGVLTVSKVIEQNDRAGWVAVYALGGLTKSNGFDSPGQAAGVVLECMTRSSTFYDGFTGATLLDSRATTVSGQDAWVMDAEIRIDNPDLKVEGDVAKVVVVETGDPQRYGMFVSVVPIGDQALIDQQQAQEALIKVG